MWTACYKKLAGNTMKQLPIASKTALLDKQILLVGMFRASGWPYHESLASSMDKLQARMIAVLNHVDRFGLESDAEFHRRRCHIAGA